MKRLPQHNLVFCQTTGNSKPSCCISKLTLGQHRDSGTHYFLREESWLAVGFGLLSSPTLWKKHIHWIHWFVNKHEYWLDLRIDNIHRQLELRQKLFFFAFWFGSMSGMSSIAGCFYGICSFGTEINDCLQARLKVFRFPRHNDLDEILSKIHF